MEQLSIIVLFISILVWLIPAGIQEYRNGKVSKKE